MKCFFFIKVKKKKSYLVYFYSKDYYLPQWIGIQFNVFYGIVEGQIW